MTRGERQERFLALFEAGRSIQDAAAGAQMSPRTVNGWLSRGRGEDSGPYADFAARFDRIRSAAGENRLAEADLVRLLEKQARRGSVQAMKYLLERPWERRKSDADDDEAAEKPSALARADELAQRRAGRG